MDVEKNGVVKKNSESLKEIKVKNEEVIFFFYYPFLYSLKIHSRCYNDVFLNLFATNLFITKLVLTGDFFSISSVRQLFLDSVALTGFVTVFVVYFKKRLVNTTH